ncbi:hypothetical protein IAT38_004494 [Cryptococcus sp. DSM 104549]
MTGTTAPHPALEVLRRQYLALYPIYLLSLPAPSILATDAAQAYLLTHLLGDSSDSVDEGESSRGKERVWLGPEESYQKKAWKKIVDSLEIGVSGRVESGDDEAVVDERFYEHLAGLMVSSTNDLEPGPSFRTFVYDLPPSGHSLSTPHGGSITLMEEQIAIQGGTTGLRTWTAALHLAHHILHHPSTLFSSTRSADPSTPIARSSRPVVELGAGTGFVSVLLAQLGVDVVATDLGDGDDHEEEDEGEGEEEAGGMDGIVRTPLGRLQYNIALNDCIVKPTVRHLDWFDARKTPSDRPAIWAQLLEDKRDIVAADVIYDPDLIPPLVDAIDVLLGDGHDERVALISATIRNQETFDKFVVTCRQHGLALEMLDLPPMDPSAPTFWDSALDAGTPVRLMRITNPPCAPHRISYTTSACSV